MKNCYSYCKQIARQITHYDNDDDYNDIQMLYILHSYYIPALQKIKESPYRSIQQKLMVTFSKVINIYLSKDFLLLPTTVTTEHKLQRWNASTVFWVQFENNGNYHPIKILSFFFLFFPIRPNKRLME